MNKIKSKLIMCFIYTTVIYLLFNNVLAKTDITCSYNSIDNISEYPSNTTNNLKLYCNYSLLMDASSGNILFEKNGFKKVYPASTTKIITAILTIEKLKLTDTVVVSKSALSQIADDSSVMGTKVGEVLSVQNLLYGLMLPSGNDAANILAEAVSGNIQDFIVLMNNKAKEIGCKNTHFNNAHGYYDPNHYTTPYDMALILKYALKYKELTEIMETKTIELPENNKTSEKRTLTNSNKMILEEYPDIFYDYILGGKTGYTVESRGTFVGYGKKDDKLVIVTDFDGSQNINGNQARFLDAKVLFNYAFNNFKTNVIIDKSDFTYTINDYNAKKKYIVGINDSKSSLTKNDSYNIMPYNFCIDIDKLNNEFINQDVGYINILTLGDGTRLEDNYQIKLQEIQDIEIKHLDSKKPYIYIAVIVILFIILFKYNKYKKRKKQRNGKRK